MVYSFSPFLFSPFISLMRPTPQTERTTSGVMSANNKLKFKYQIDIQDY